MNINDNGHWKAEILPVARFGSSCSGQKPQRGDRTDLAYDNEALDVLTELFDNDNSDLPEELLNQQTKDSPQIQRRIDNRTEVKTNPSTAAVQNHTLPDSPPYSGSEAYSPERMLSPSSQSHCSESSVPSGYVSGQSPDPQHRSFDMNQQQQLHNHVLLQQQQLQHQQQMQQLHERQVQLHLQQQAALQNGAAHMIIPPMNMQRLPQMLPPEDMMAPQPYNNETHSPFPPSNKKRKFVSDSSPHAADSSFLHQQVKSEPAVPTPHVVPQPCDYDESSVNGGGVAAGSMDISPSMLNTGSYQPIKWREFQKQACCPLITAQGQRVSLQTYRLDGDKGFNFSQIDKAFVCQKKNHFQITSCLSFNDCPGYVMSPDGPKPIEGLFMHFYGVKEEAPNQVIQVDQSQADRSKRKFDPVPLHPNQENSWKVTIGRLHFSDTTLNNMRKRGKPNPDQRYFLLVVGIFAHSGGKEYPVVQQCSEKLIVRVFTDRNEASNPGQFQDSEVEPVKWQPGQTPNSVFHSGKVGINTDSPDEALTVAGNVKVMGTIMQPSDRRVKEDITQTDTKEQLKNLQNIQLYNYRYTEEFADAVGLDDPNKIETGVIAQELEVVIPDAVKTTTDVQLPTGEVIDQLKVVDKNRLFMESLGAVQELCNVTDSLENKITYLERFNQKLKKLKRIGSLRSTGSADSDLSRVTSISTISHVTVRRKRRGGKDMCTSIGKDKADSGTKGVCSNRFLQILIFVLVFVMVACVGVILAMLLLEKTQSDNGDALNSRENIESVLPSTTRPDVGWTTVKPTPHSSLWLMGKNCEDSGAACSWDHCKNQCKLLTDGFPLTSLPSDRSFQVNIGSTHAPYDVIEYSVGEGSKQSGSKSQGYGDRRKRSLDERNPVQALNISLTEPIPFNITDMNCFDCEKGANNFSYAVQVSHSYPGTNAKLNIGYINDGSPKPTHWKRVVLCSVPTEPENFYANRCSDTSSMRDELFDVTPSYPVEPMLLSDGAEFQIEVGKVFKNVYIFRLTDMDQLNTEEICSAPLSESVTEFRIWFLRICYNQPQNLAGLTSDIFGSKGPTTNSDQVNIDGLIANQG